MTGGNKRVDGEVETHAVVEVRVVEAKHAVEVGSPVKLGINGGDLSVLEGVAVDQSGKCGQLGNEVNAVLVCERPVVGLERSETTSVNDCPNTLFMPLA
jgi:hypothetical protein